MVKGSQETKLIMDLVLQEESLEEGQSIITSGTAGIFPAGLLIGRIDKVLSSDPQIFQQAEITVPVVDFSRLEKVFILTK